MASSISQLHLSCIANTPISLPTVGSFLRPQSIHTARSQFLSGSISSEDLREIEDAAIRELAKKEEAAGLRGVSDGEYRREYFHLDFLKNVGGVKVTENNLPGDKKEAVPPSLSVVSKLEWVKPIQVADYLFLKSLLTNPKSEVKVAIPSPSMVHFRGGRAAVDIESYPDMEKFFEDLAEVWRQEIKALYEAGCRYVQLDDTVSPPGLFLFPSPARSYQSPSYLLRTSPTSVPRRCVKPRPNVGKT
jgi:5-methyltetrahydropteroyltriglutamate--homocysteine methyltransferase